MNLHSTITLKKTSFTSVVTEAILVKFSIHPHMLCVFLTIFSQTNIKQNKSDRTWDSFTWLQKKKIIKLKKIKKRMKKCDALHLDPVIFQTLTIPSLGKTLIILHLFFTLMDDEGDFGVHKIL